MNMDKLQPWRKIDMDKLQTTQQEYWPMENTKFPLPSLSLLVNNVIESRNP